MIKLFAKYGLLRPALNHVSDVEILSLKSLCSQTDFSFPRYLHIFMNVEK